MHYTGEADAGPETLTPDEYAHLFGRYVGDLGQAAESYKILVGLGLGQRAFVRFHPLTRVTWDFAKIPPA